MENQQAPAQQITINVGNQKSMLAAIILSFFFGPLGLLYASIFGGLVMIGIYIAIGIISVVSLGFGTILYLPAWFACVLWAVIAVKGNEKRVIELIQKGDFKQVGSVVVDSAH